MIGCDAVLLVGYLVLLVDRSSPLAGPRLLIYESVYNIDDCRYVPQVGIRPFHWHPGMLVSVGIAPLADPSLLFVECGCFMVEGIRLQVCINYFAGMCADLLVQCICCCICIAFVVSCICICNALSLIHI